MSINPVGLKGIEFIEFCSNEPDQIHKLFTNFGFSKLLALKNEELIYYFLPIQIFFLVWSY